MSLLGQTSETNGDNLEEYDLKARNTKKIRGGDHNFSSFSFFPKDYRDLVQSGEENKRIFQRDGARYHKSEERRWGRG